MNTKVQDTKMKGAKYADIFRGERNDCNNTHTNYLAKKLVPLAFISWDVSSHVYEKNRSTITTVRTYRTDDFSLSLIFEHICK